MVRSIATDFAIAAQSDSSRVAWRVKKRLINEAQEWNVRKQTSPVRTNIRQVRSCRQSNQNKILGDLLSSGLAWGRPNLSEVPFNCQEILSCATFAMSTKGRFTTFSSGMPSCFKSLREPQNVASVTWMFRVMKLN